MTSPPGDIADAPSGRQMAVEMAEQPARLRGLIAKTEEIAATVRARPATGRGDLDRRARVLRSRRDLR